MDGQQQESQDRSVVDGTENAVDRGEKAQDALEVKDGKKDEDSGGDDQKCSHAGKKVWILLLYIKSNKSRLGFYKKL